MQKFVAILLLSCFYFSLSAQVKHELKIPVINMLGLDFHPSYEILVMDEKIGFELGAGFNLSKQSLRSRTDTLNNLFSEGDKYKSRVFKSSFAVKFYLNYSLNQVGFQFFAGPFVAFDKIAFYEESFLIRQAEIVSENEFYRSNFIGEREIRTGISSGVKLVHNSNMLLELSGRVAVVFEERTPGNVEFRRAYFLTTPALKFGYRFGEKPALAEVE